MEAENEALYEAVSIYQNTRSWYQKSLNTMASQTYKEQVVLLLTVLPEVAKEECFAMHGGTAINLFIRDMPRISVDIDLTYLPLEDRATSIENITSSLQRIKSRIEKLNLEIVVEHKKDSGKLLVSRKGLIIKLEVNLVMRGVIASTQLLPLCKRAQNEFDTYAEMTIVPSGQLFGGKYCAALDRQHPRDMFDVKYQLGREEFTPETKAGFLYCLLSSDRPTHELLNPQLQDQRMAMENQFAGMTEELFPYEEYESIRIQVATTIHKNLTQIEIEFLLDFMRMTPNWKIYNFQNFPSIRWKMMNLQKLLVENPAKFKQQYELLEKTLIS